MGSQGRPHLMLRCFQLLIVLLQLSMVVMRVFGETTAPADVDWVWIARGIG